MTLENFVANISSEEDTENLVEILLHDLTQRFEIKLVNYGAYAALSEFDRHTLHPTGIFSFSPPEWTKRYVDQDYFGKDDAFGYLRQGSHTRSWNSFKRSIVFDEASEFGCPEGLAIPLIGLGGVRAGLMFGGAPSLAEPDVAALLDAYAKIFHTRYEMVGRRQNPFELIPLQLEILKWMGQDKSKTDIADILGQSNSNIDYHFREIYRKLGAGSKLGAVLKAMMMGIIDPEFDKFETTQLRSRE